MASRSINDLAPVVRLAAIKFVDTCRKQGIDALIYCTLRSHEEQEALYKIGRSINGAKVTNARAGQSGHNPDANGQAWAFDAVPVVQGVAQWGDMATIKRMGAIGESCGLQWSGRWTTNREYLHFEIKQIKGGAMPEFNDANVPAQSGSNLVTDRLKEPSTWAGFAAILQAAKFFFPQYAMIIDGLTALVGALAVKLPEVKK